LPEAGPKLAAVPPPTTGPARKPAASPAQPGRRERTRLAVLAALLVVALIGLASELVRNARLEARVASLGAELDATLSRLHAHELRLDEVRVAVAKLHALVQGDPAPAPPSPQP
jgi:hypothetical protein